MQYPINEMFQTLQGEGYFTGVPAIFIRLQGCPVGCARCDTKHTREKRGSGSLLFSILAKTKESDKWGLRAVKICWLSLVAEGIHRAACGDYGW